MFLLLSPVMTGGGGRVRIIALSSLPASYKYIEGYGYLFPWPVCLRSIRVCLASHSPPLNKSPHWNECQLTVKGVPSTYALIPWGTKKGEHLSKTWAICDADGFLLFSSPPDFNSNNCGFTAIFEKLCCQVSHWKHSFLQDSTVILHHTQPQHFIALFWLPYCRFTAHIILHRNFEVPSDKN